MITANITNDLANELIELFKARCSAIPGMEVVDYSNEINRVLKVWDKDEDFFASIMHDRVFEFNDTLVTDVIIQTVDGGTYSCHNFEIAKLIISFINTDEKIELINTLISTI